MIALCGGIVLEEALDLSFDRLLMMMMMMRVDVYVGKPTYIKVRSESWSV